MWATGRAGKFVTLSTNLFKMFPAYLVKKSEYNIMQNKMAAKCLTTFPMPREAPVIKMTQSSGIEDVDAPIEVISGAE
jgi:hypothetical protein